MSFCLFVFSICLFYLCIHCHCIALQLSNAWWISVRCMVQYKCSREKNIFRGENMYFQQKSSKIIIWNFSKYNVTETFLECFASTGMSFIIIKNIKTFRFEWKLVERNCPEYVMCPEYGELTLFNTIWFWNRCENKPNKMRLNHVTLEGRKVAIITEKRYASFPFLHYNSLHTFKN